jgi:hypothetical protein
MAYQTPQDLDLYLVVGKKEMKFIDVEYQVQVGCWATKNHLRDYKIYVTLICMFDEDFLNSLVHPPKDNPWLAHSTNRNYRIQFLR